MNNKMKKLPSLKLMMQVKGAVINTGTNILRYTIHFNLIQFIYQLRALKGQQENCTLMNKQYAQ